MINDDARQKIKKKISEFCESGFDSEKLLEIEDDIIALDDAELSCFFAQKVRGANLYDHRNIICKSNRASLMYEFMTSVTMSIESRNEIALKIIETDNEKYITMLCDYCFIDSNIRDKAKIWLMNHGSKKYIYYYLTTFERPITTDFEIDVVRTMVKRIYNDLTLEEKESLQNMYPDITKEVELQILEENEVNKIKQLINTITYE